MDTSDYVYLDYAASAPIRKSCLEAQAAFRKLDCSVANPNSLHSLGRECANVINGARRDFVRLVGSRFIPQEVLFTSGGTESNNLAIFGIAQGVRNKDRSRTKVLISAIEHDSIIDCIGPLRGMGFEVELLHPNSQGVIEPEELKDHLDDKVGLVSVMYANNETGVIQPVDQLAKLTHEYGGYFHTDAVQAFGHIPIDCTSCDAVSFAAHKIGGPVGVGALCVRRKCPIRPISFGGGQEMGLRPGTQDTAGIIGFIAAAKEVVSILDKTRPEVEKRANMVYSRLCAPGTHMVPTTTPTATGKLPGLVSVMVKKLDAQTVLLRLDDAGFGISSGSACASASLDPSHVLSAMGIDSSLAFGALRISFDERVTWEQLEAMCDTLITIT